MRSRKLVLAAAVMAVAALLLAACGSATTPEAATQAPPVIQTVVVTQEVQVTPPPGPAAGSVTVTGAGATFPAPIYQKWFYDYAFVDNSVTFNYQGIGSGGGISAITAKTVDFAGSDAILNAAQKQAAPDVLMFPTVSGAVTISYNLKDNSNPPAPIKGLKLDGPTIVGIFSGKITSWSDPVLAKLNPDLKLPNAPITVATRSDGSGTTFAFTNYLAAISPDWQKSPGIGTSVKWPGKNVLSGKGNPGVASILTNTPNSIGYVDIGDAIGNGLTFADVANSSGKYITPGVDAIIAAQKAFAGSMPDDMGQVIVNASDPAAYPIATYTFLLLHKDMPDCAKAAAIIKWYHWAQTKGADDAKSLQYAPLGPDVQALVFKRMAANLTCNGGKPIDGNTPS